MLKHAKELDWGLDRLDFQLPEFTRISWVGDRARDAWQPRMQRIGSAWTEIEWRTVLEDVRPACVTMSAPEDLPRRAGAFARHGLSTLPIELQGLGNYGYSNAAVKAKLGAPFQYRLVVGTPAVVSRFQEAWDGADQDVIGELLGYPPCCRRFFEEVWVQRQMRDTTWPMAVRTAGGASTGERVRVAGPPHANILWRWMGVRLAFHLPCRLEIGRAHV